MRASMPFDQRLDFRRGDERSLDVDLRELRLAVGAQILVAEAAGDLEIFLDAGDLQQLLVLLRRLRQRVERAGVEPRRHEEIARTLRRRVGEDGRLDLEEAGFVEKIARGLGHAVAGAQVAPHVARVRRSR